MSIACGVECVVCFGCSRWAWKRLTYIGAYDSESWPLADPSEFEPVPRICRAILAVYEDDIAHPRFPPDGGYRMDPKLISKHTTYTDTQGQCPPYLIYTDTEHREIILAIRGLNLTAESDYKVLLDNRLGMQMFDAGYVHHGLLKAATWLLNQEADTLRDLWLQQGPDYRLVIAGHSLGSGIAALMTVIIVNHRDRLGGIPRSQVRCYAIAPARCMSLNLAVKYADVIHSVILQDDFLPRTPTPLENIFGSIFCLPCLLFLVCMRDTFISERKKLKDPRRLYAPGRMYHIVERKFCRCGRFPPEVRTAIPVEGRFEHVVLSCNATSDHGIVWIEREAQKALNLMNENVDLTSPPPQKMERKQTLEKEHNDALERIVSLNVPNAMPPPTDSAKESSDDTPVKIIIEEPSDVEIKIQEPSSSNVSSCGRTNWDELVQKLFDKNKSGNLVLKRDIPVR